MSTAARKFNWADSSDSDDDCSPVVASNATPVAQKAPAPMIPTSSRTNGGGLSEDEADGNTTNTNSPALGAARELQYTTAEEDALTPLRHCQEVMIQAAIPYTLKSVWNGSNNNNAGRSPVVVSAAAAALVPTLPSGGVSPIVAPAAAAPSVPSPAAPVVAAAPKPIRMNRALDELTSVLRASNGSLPYDELMNRSQWRSRFQPSFGSLFTFIKRNREIFRYKQSVVELVMEAGIVTELLKMNWAATAAAAATANLVSTSVENTPKRN